MSGLDPTRAPRDIGGLPQTVVDAWIHAERPNPVAFAVVAGASFFLAVPLFTGTDSVPSSPGEDPTLVAVLAASVENAVASGDVLVLGGGLLAMVGLAWLVHWVYRWLRDHLGTPPIVRVLRDRPTTIVWAYPTRVTHATANGLSERVVRRSVTLTLGLDDGRTFRDLPVRDDELDLVLRALRARSSRLVVGYSDELQRRFRRSPRSFATTD